MEYTDETDIEAEARYRCASCREISLGKQLLPIIRRRLKEDPETRKIVPTGELVCNVRRCPHCRGDMKKITETLPLP